MSEWDKNFTAETFSKPAEENNKSVILVATDFYSIDINNSDVKFMVQWDLFLLFDSMIQCMRRSRRKGGA